MQHIVSQKTSLVTKTTEPEKENKFAELKVPRLTVEQQRLLLVGEGVSLDSAKQYNAYINSSIDQRGADFATAISQGTKRALYEVTGSPLTASEMRERDRLQMQMQTQRASLSVRSAQELEEERIRREFSDNVSLEMRQDMAGKQENDGSAKDEVSSEAEEMDSEEVAESSVGRVGEKLKFEDDE